MPTKKLKKPVTTHQGEYEPPCMFFFAFAGSQELHDIKIQQVREAEAQASVVGTPFFVENGERTRTKATFVENYNELDLFVFEHGCN